MPGMDLVKGDRAREDKVVAAAVKAANVVEEAAEKVVEEVEEEAEKLEAQVDEAVEKAVEAEERAEEVVEEGVKVASVGEALEGGVAARLAKEEEAVEKAEKADEEVENTEVLVKVSSLSTDSDNFLIILKSFFSFAAMSPIHYHAGIWKFQVHGYVRYLKKLSWRLFDFVLIETSKSERGSGCP